MSPSPIAVFDLGKTNSKLFVLSADGKVIDEARTRPVWKKAGDLTVLDDTALFAWMKGELARVVSTHGVDRMIERRLQRVHARSVERLRRDERQSRRGRRRADDPDVVQPLG